MVLEREGAWLGERWLLWEKIPQYHVFNINTCYAPNGCNRKVKASHIRKAEASRPAPMKTGREAGHGTGLDERARAEPGRGVGPGGPRPDGSSPRASAAGARPLCGAEHDFGQHVKWSDALQEALGVYWTPITRAVPEDRTTFIRILAQGELAPVLDELGLNPEELAQQVEDRLARYNDDAILNIRQEEYRQFVLGADTADMDAREFEVRSVSLPDSLRPFFSRIVRVVRLREVRALKGFTRINPPGDENSPDIAAIAVGQPGWLPAIEVRGEGIFLAFNQETLRPWEVQDIVQDRARKVHAAWHVEWQKRYGEGDPAWPITPRYLLAHTFAHALMRQFTLECGYSTAALRERLYVSEGNDGMAGLLIYTATSDADGTLGGLQRQGESRRIEHAVGAAVRAMEWCSSDPLCIGGLVAGTDGLSLAACHACVFAPETACEEYNRFLDRALLVGLPDSSDAGFFSPLLRAV